MPKLKSVTVDELKSLADKAQDVGQECAFIGGRATAGYMDEVESPVELATAFMGASAALADLARLMLMKAMLQEQRAELEKHLHNRMSGVL